MIEHQFVPDPHGRDVCDKKVDEDGRSRLCGLRRVEHTADVTSKAQLPLPQMPPEQAQPRPAPRLARVHFAANDRHGNFTGKAEAIQIELPDDEEIEFYTDGMPVARFHRKRGEKRISTVRIGGRGGITVRSFGWQSWIGNMAWDATAVRLADAKKLVRWLLEHNATVEANTCDGPLEAIIKEVEAQRRTPKVAAHG